MYRKLTDKKIYVYSDFTVNREAYVPRTNTVSPTQAVSIVAVTRTNKSCLNIYITNRRRAAFVDIYRRFDKRTSARF